MYGDRKVAGIDYWEIVSFPTSSRYELNRAEIFPESHVSQRLIKCALDRTLPCLEDVVNSPYN